MRLIDADELIERTWRWAVNSREAVQQMIKGCPTIDAVPVRHGKWRNMGFKDEWYGYIYTCSECGHEHMAESDEFYCPHCGARLELDGGDKDETD